MNQFGLSSLRVVALLAVLSGVVGASAQVSAYATDFYEDRLQESDAEPTFQYGAAWSASIGAVKIGDLLSGQVITPLASPQPMYLATDEYLLTGSNYFPTVADLAVDYPDGNYTFDILTGAAGPATANLFVPPYDFPTAVPYLTGGTYSGLQLAPANVAAPISWLTYTNTGLATNLQTGMYVYDSTNSSSYVASYSGPGNIYSGDTIPASDMKSGHHYEYVLDFICSLDVAADGFGGAPSYVSFHRRASGSWKVKANPGTVSGQIALEDVSYFYGEPIKIEVLDGATVVDTQTLNIDYYGWYAFDTTVPAGTYNIRFKARHWLSKIAPNVDISVGQDYLNISLLNGDLDGDNDVTILDYSVLSDYFDKTYLEADWTTVGDNGFAPKDADLDNDLSVSILDYSYLSNNFDKSGE